MAGVAPNMSAATKATQTLRFSGLEGRNRGGDVGFCVQLADDSAIKIQYKNSDVRNFPCRGGFGAHKMGAEEARKARFSALILPYLSHAYRLARSLTGNQTDAEDVVQEACMRAFRAIDSVTDTNARPWLLTIVHHTGCTWLRKNRPAALIGVDDLAAAEAQSVSAGEQSTNTPEADLIAKSNQTQLETAIAKLSLPFRETLLLRDVEGLNYKEIAEVTGVPIGTVMSRLARARGQVISMIGNKE